MGLQDTFAQQLQAQIDAWEKQAKDFRAQADKAEAQARAEYEKNLKSLEKTVDQAGKILAQVQQVNEAAWKDMEASTVKAFEDLKKGWEDALARYR